MIANTSTSIDFEKERCPDVTWLRAGHHAMYMPMDAAIRYVETKPANKDDHVVIRKLKHIKIL